MAPNSLAIYTPEKQQEIVELMGFKGTQQHTALLFQLAEHYQLDPLTKEIALIPGKGPFIGVWGRLHIAHRSGMLDGLEMDDEEEDDRHYKVRCIVWRKDQQRPAAKVLGRVGRHEKKEWPFEIARARAVRAALGFSFSIHDAYDTQDEDDWAPAPDERLQASVTPPEPDEKPRRARKVSRTTGEVVDVEPATVVVGGHTLAQRLAMAAKEAGIDDDQTRWDVIRAATDGAAGRGQEVNEEQAPRVLEAFGGLAGGSVELRYEPDGTPRLFRVGKR